MTVKELTELLKEGTAVDIYKKKERLCHVDDSSGEGLDLFNDFNVKSWQPASEKGVGFVVINVDGSKCQCGCSTCGGGSSDTSTTGPQPGSISQDAKPVPQSTSLLGVTMDELISSDTKIVVKEGKECYVEGTLKNKQSFEGFDKNQENNSGHFFPFNIGKVGGTFTFKKNGVVARDNVPNDDGNIIIKVTDTTTIWEILLDGVTVIKLDFSKATLA